jgi:aubergine-like protein
LKAIRQNIRPTLKMVICILTTNRKDRYDAIKKVCCVDNPVPSQCIVGRTISKPQMMMSVCTKVAIQLNCKMGGEVWAVDIPMKKGMVVGFDTYHDSVNKGQSVGGFVASVNPSLTRYDPETTNHHL